MYTKKVRGVPHPLPSIRNVAVICPTYRNPLNSSVLRTIGPVCLIDQMRLQDFQGQINVVVVDSSAEPHPFFEPNASNSELRYAYLHIPSRNATATLAHKTFPKAMRFIPNDKKLFSTPKWVRQYEEGKAWGRFIPWDADYPLPRSMEAQMQDDRPSIGMKRNAAIAAAAETFGPPDLIIQADDDDFRSPSYVRLLAEGIGDHDFTRMADYFTFTRLGDLRQYGRYNVGFQKDINGNWAPPLNRLDERVFNTTFLKTGQLDDNIGTKFARAKCIAFPPISYEGALHAFRYNHWKRAANKFGGFPIVSFAEDVLFYLKCRNTFGENFSACLTEVDEPAFLRTGYGDNASVIDWTENLAKNDVPEWAMKNIEMLELIDQTKESLDFKEAFNKLKQDMTEDPSLEMSHFWVNYLSDTR